MARQRQLYRSRDALVGGVCGGIADYFHLDPVITRILGVALVVLTGGVMGVAYLILWALLEREPEQSAPYEIEPEEVNSETYGRVDFETARGRARDVVRPAVMSGLTAAQARFASGHVPPEPPASLRRFMSSFATEEDADTGADSEEDAAQTAASTGGIVVERGSGTSELTGESVDDALERIRARASRAVPSADDDARAVAPSADVDDFVVAAADEALFGDAEPAAEPASAAASAPSSAPVAATQAIVQVRPAKATSKRAVGIGLVCASCILFVVGSVLVAGELEGVSWWMLWPLLLVIFGLARMIVLSEPGHRMDGFVVGLVAFAAGSVMVPMALGVVSWATVGVAFVHLWPLLAAAVVLLVVGNAAHAPLVKLTAALAFVAFCYIGLAFYALPGAAYDLSVSIPLDRELRFYTFSD